AVRNGADITLDEGDVERQLTAITEAASQADVVLFSLHEHLWPAEWKDVAFLPEWPSDWNEPLPWKQKFARQAIDAGATAVLCHGMPRGSAIENYRGCPI